MIHPGWFQALSPGDRVLVTFNDGSFAAQAVESVYLRGQTTSDFDHAFVAPADLIAVDDWFFTEDGAELMPDDDDDRIGATVGPLTLEMDARCDAISAVEKIDWCSVPADKLRAVLALVTIQ